MPKLSALFNSVFMPAPKRNKFDLGHEKKLSLDPGYLYPVMTLDCLPNESYRISHEVFMRMMPMLAPVMHRVDVYTHSFAVPYRLVWDEFEDFATGGKDGLASPVVPHIVINDSLKDMGFFDVTTLWDYMGLPPMATGSAAVTDPIQISVLFFRAYQLIYDEYYRDQNLQDSLAISKASGLVDSTEAQKLLTLRLRSWEKDMFTSALPDTQRGPEVLMPVSVGGDAELYVNPVGGPGTVTNARLKGTEEPGSIAVEYGMNIDETLPNGEIVARLDDLDSSTSIRELRRATKLQEFYEMMMRIGARYVEFLKGVFGAKPKDSRMQRPEYLGGGRQTMRISEVLQTSFTPDDGTAQGNMAGHGISNGASNRFTYTTSEHCMIITILSVLPRTGYMDGIARHFRKFDRFDWFLPQFQRIGEQEVKVSELYYRHNDPAGQADETFGYQSRFVEYKYIPNSAHGYFRTTLSYWHWDRMFTEKPVLDIPFIQANVDRRIFAVDEPGVLLCQMYNHVDALRPMEFYGTSSF